MITSEIKIYYYVVRSIYCSGIWKSSLQILWARHLFRRAFWENKSTWFQVWTLVSLLLIVSRELTVQVHTKFYSCVLSACILEQVVGAPVKRSEGQFLLLNPFETPPFLAINRLVVCLNPFISATFCLLLHQMFAHMNGYCKLGDWLFLIKGR